MYLLPIKRQGTKFEIISIPRLLSRREYFIWLHLLSDRWVYLDDAQMRHCWPRGSILWHRLSESLPVIYRNTLISLKVWSNKEMCDVQRHYHWFSFPSFQGIDNLGSELEFQKWCFAPSFKVMPGRFPIQIEFLN